MLYTSYLAKLDLIPKNINCILITLYPPDDFVKEKTLGNFLQVGYLKDKKVYLCKYLAPNEEILRAYKMNNNWGLYQESFNKLLDSFNAKYSMKALSILIEKGFDICLICYEKDHTKCHRTLVAERIEDLYQIEWEELKFPKRKKV